VVVHERSEVEPLVASQQEGEDVRLPELVRLGPLEPPFRVLPRRRRRALLEEALLVKDPPDGALGDAERLEPAQHVRDSTGPVLGMFLLQRRHRLAPGVGRLGPDRRHDGLRHERVQPARPEAADPFADRRCPEPEHSGDLSQGRALVYDLADDA
jgi:hypothetical protein